MTLAIGYAWASLGARRPMLAGLFVALGFATRPPWLVFPLFFFEAGARRPAAGARCAPRDGLARASPIDCCAFAAADRRRRRRSWLRYNWARFGSPFEFGHKYLAVQWQERMYRFGLFNYHFLSRNLAAALVLLPRMMTHCAVREDQPARHEHAGDVAEPGLHGDAAGAAVRCAARCG